MRFASGILTGGGQNNFFLIPASSRLRHQSSKTGWGQPHPHKNKHCLPLPYKALAIKSQAMACFHSGQNLLGGMKGRSHTTLPPSVMRWTCNSLKIAQSRPTWRPCHEGAQAKTAGLCIIPVNLDDPALAEHITSVLKQQLQCWEKKMESKLQAAFLPWLRKLQYNKQVNSFSIYHSRSFSRCHNAALAAWDTGVWLEAAGEQCFYVHW